MVELVADGGYQSITVRRLTKLARVSTGTFYSQFDGTDECFISTYLVLMEQIARQVAATRTPSLPLPDQAADAVRTLVDGFSGDQSVAHFALTDVLAGGPAALMSIRTQEKRLTAALRESLNRRGKEFSVTTSGWITAGAMHAVRSNLPIASMTHIAKLSDAVVAWAEQFPDRAVCAPSTEAPKSRRPFTPVKVPRRNNETEFALGAVMRLAARGGFWRLTASSVSKTAGIPKTHFVRHFADVKSAYLMGLCRLARTFFLDSWRGTGPHTEWRQEVCGNVLECTQRLASQPALARLVLNGILEPGIDGLRCKELMIDEIARSWSSAIPSTERPEPLILQTGVAALWAMAARWLEAGPSESTSKMGPTLASLFLASLPRAARLNLVDPPRPVRSAAPAIP